NVTGVQTCALPIFDEAFCRRRHSLPVNRECENKVVSRKETSLIIAHLRIWLAIAAPSEQVFATHRRIKIILAQIDQVDYTIRCLYTANSSGSYGGGKAPPVRPVHCASKRLGAIQRQHDPST